MKIVDLLTVDCLELGRLSDNPRYKGLIQRKLRLLARTKMIHQVNYSNYWLVDKLENPSESIDLVLEGFLSQASGKWFEVKGQSFLKRCAHEQLEEMIRNLPKEEAIVIRDFPETDYCGYAWLTADGNTYIEAYKGGFWGLWNAEAIPSHYLYSKMDGVVSKHVNPAKGYFMFNYDEDKWERKECEQELVDISDELLEIINEFVRKINHNKIKMKIAWIINSAGVTVFDIFIPLGVSSIE